MIVAWAESAAAASMGKDDQAFGPLRNREQSEKPTGANLNRIGVGNRVAFHGRLILDRSWFRIEPSVSLYGFSLTRTANPVSVSA
jgi:hypothetical protein